MTKSISLAAVLVAVAASAAPLRAPVKSDGSAEQLLAEHWYGKKNNLSTAERAAAENGLIHSVPTWKGAFTYQGTTYPFFMVGKDPQAGESTTRIDTAIVPIAYRFDGFIDPATGTNLVMDISAALPLVVRSPNFVDAPYGTGTTQFADAVQRAQFWNVGGDRWHTLLNAPRVLPTVTIEVPEGAANVVETENGARLAVISGFFFDDALLAALRQSKFRSNELAMAVGPNTCVAEGGGCALGYHGVYGAGQAGQTFFVQTFLFVSWLDPGVAPGLSDATALSHEISEWMNDPFIGNATPVWSFPGHPYLCQANLETGDPVEVLPNPTFPVVIDGFTYHPQTEALLQWFTRESPSSAFGGAYSYPDMTALTAQPPPGGPPPPPPPPPAR